MRLITGDECGLLKETIPELSRPACEDANESHAAVPFGRTHTNTVDVGVQRLELGEGVQTRARGVVGMTFAPPPAFKDLDDENEDDDDDDSDVAFAFAALRIDGSVEMWTGSQQERKGMKLPAFYRKVQTVNNVFADLKRNENDSSGSTFAVGRPIGICSPLGSSHRQTTSTNGQVSNNYSNIHVLACADSLGNISILDTQKNCSVVAQYDAYKSGTNTTAAKNTNNDGNNARNNPTVTYTKGKLPNMNIAAAMDMDPYGHRVAIGGRERETRLLDSERGDVIWKAKNLPPDPQTLLQHPIWPTCIRFLNSTTTCKGSNDILAVGTAYRELRLYDIRTSDATTTTTTTTTTTRRPILHTPEGMLPHRITSLCQQDDFTLLLGDGAGYIHALDIRYIHHHHRRHSKNGKNNNSNGMGIGRFKGPAGSVRQIVKHESLPIMSCVSLDRMVRTYDVNTRRLLDCVYLKQRLNCVLICEDGTWLSTTTRTRGRVDNDDDGNSVGEEEEKGNDDGMDSSNGGDDIDVDDEVEDYVDSDEEQEGVVEWDIAESNNNNDDDDMDNDNENEETSNDESSEDENEEISSSDESGEDENDEDEGESSEDEGISDEEVLDTNERKTRSRGRNGDELPAAKKKRRG